jgi:hypothetical protein
VRAKGVAGTCACALAIACGSSDPPGSASDTNKGGDPQWGEGFATRLNDGGSPDAPASVAQACALFGGEPWDYPTIDDVKTRLASHRWLGCADNSRDTEGFWPAGFIGIVFDVSGSWLALVLSADGSIQGATQGNSTGTFQVDPYPLDTPQAAAEFVLHFLPNGVTDPGLAEQWQGYFEDSPEILSVDSSTGRDTYRFSSASP